MYARTTAVWNYNFVENKIKKVVKKESVYDRHRECGCEWRFVPTGSEPLPISGN